MENWPPDRSAPDSQARQPNRDRRCGYRHVPCPLATHDESAVALQQPDGGRARWRRTPAARRSATGDHPQDVGGRGLPLQRLLGFVEQPRILDRDHRLVGESLLQRQLAVGEWREPVAVDDQGSDRLGFVSKRRSGTVRMPSAALPSRANAPCRDRHCRDRECGFAGFPGAPSPAGPRRLRGRSTARLARNAQSRHRPIGLTHLSPSASGIVTLGR